MSLIPHRPVVEAPEFPVPHSAFVRLRDVSRGTSSMTLALRLAEKGKAL
jgi:hypothetical protein